MKKITIIVLAFIVASLFLSGCAQQIRLSQRTYLGTDRVFDKNYQIGQSNTAYVGQPIIKVKDYKVNRFKSKHMRATDNFVISGGQITITGDKNTNYVVLGDTTIDEKTYTVINLPANDLGWVFGVLVNNDGSVHNKILISGNNTRIVTPYTFTASPADLKFVASKDEEVDIDSGYLNYELIYGGTDGKSFTVTYREYTSNDLARPAFYQNLIYEIGKNQIRFRDTVIQIREATNEKIVFTVTSDGISK